MPLLNIGLWILNISSVVHIVDDKCELMRLWLLSRFIIVFYIMDGLLLEIRVLSIW